MNKIIVYGIPNCDSVKKTLAWYHKKSIDVELHDYKKVGITKSKLQEWCKQVGWQTLLNKKSTTWRALPPEVQQKANNEQDAINTMISNTSLIKRPVIEMNDKIIVGFNETYFSKQ